MDPLTQGALGAALPQATGRKSVAGAAGVFGFLAGMAADLDVFIRSASDPLMFLDYHRQFTHALIFIPLGGLICALILYGLVGRRWRVTFKHSLLYCTLGYATHGLLDTCTTYGTMLLWPFSDQRFAWNAVSVVDPVVTLPVVVLVLMAGLKRRRGYAQAALAWVAAYMSLGVLQRDAAVEMARDLAATRGHSVIRIEAKPSFANIMVWKTVYETPARFYVDAVRPRLSPRVFPGGAVAKLDVARDFPWLDPKSQQARDIERFRWFSDGYVARDPRRADRVVDIRYSLVPNDLAALWSIELSPDAGPAAHARFRTHRDGVSGAISTLWQMMFSNSAD